MSKHYFDGTPSAAAQICKLNDRLRTEGRGGHMCISAGIIALGPDELCAVQEKVMSFKDFTSENDPYGEHDFGMFEHNGSPIIWKIDYYDNAQTYGSPNPTDPSLTTRIITIMLGSEY